MVREALSNARLWEARFAAAEKSRREYRENVGQLATENEKLQKAVNQVITIYIVHPLDLRTSCVTQVGDCFSVRRVYSFPLHLFLLSVFLAHLLSLSPSPPLLTPPDRERHNPGDSPPQARGRSKGLGSE